MIRTSCFSVFARDRGNMRKARTVIRVLPLGAAANLAIRLIVRTPPFLSGNLKSAVPFAQLGSAQSSIAVESCCRQYPRASSLPSEMPKPDARNFSGSSTDLNANVWIHPAGPEIVFG